MCGIEFMLTCSFAMYHTGNGFFFFDILYFVFTVSYICKLKSCNSICNTNCKVSIMLQLILN